MGTSCRSCGAEPRVGARFCDECGTALTSAERAAEYKQVTVLFVDVVHSMDMAEALGAERLREVMGEVFNRSSAAVQRFGGTVDKFTGDGIMALFGAPMALEDHAARACLAALALQHEVARFSAELAGDGIEIAVRVGLNSGQVVAGEIGSAPMSYTAIGDQVGMAQRMESVAPPGGVMISESTARLVENVAELSGPESVTIKGKTHPVRAHRLLRMTSHQPVTAPADSRLVGRTWEMAAVEAILARVTDGHGGAVVALSGPAGIGKSRMVSEIATSAAARGVDVFGAACESHARELPFHFVAQMLRAGNKLDDVDAAGGRARLRTLFADADPEDLLLFDELVGVNEPGAVVPKVDPDARRRRLTALINAGTLARQTPAVYVLEDVHWIDEVSESMLADFIAVIPQTRSMVLITYRPEYRGVLAQSAGGQTINLAPLSDSETATLIADELGSDDSVTGLAETIADRAVGNPFFVQELVRDLAERGVLRGSRGEYSREADIAEVTVPPTLHATIAARIDRLDPSAKGTLNAAAVVGSRFAADQFTALGVDPDFEPLIGAELIDQVKFTAPELYAFHHPLIRTVAYESQLKSDRVDLHRKLAAEIQSRDWTLVEENAALIAEHLEAAGDVRDAYAWHMRAGNWSTNRDITAARTSWGRARRIADGLPVDEPDRLGMQIAPGTLLCGTAYRSGTSISASGYAELREMCTEAGDKRSLAMAVFGQMTDCMMRARVKEAARLASEQMALLESIGDPVLTVGLAYAPLSIKQETAEMTDMLRWSQAAVDLADGDPVMGNFIVGSPLALALSFRGVARCWLGIPGWRNDFDDALAMSRRTDPSTFANCVTYKLSATMSHGALLPDDALLAEVEEAFRAAVESGDHSALGLATWGLGGILVERGSPAERQRGRPLLAEIHQLCLDGKFFASELAPLEMYEAREVAKDGDLDAAIPRMRVAINGVFEGGQFTYCPTGIRWLVEALLERGSDADVLEAEAAVDRLEAAPIDGLVLADVFILYLRALLARARGDHAAHRDFAERYLRMATDFGYDGHVAVGEEMVRGLD